MRVQMLPHGWVVAEHFAAAFVGTSWKQKSVSCWSSRVNLKLTDTSDLVFVCVLFFFHFQLLVDGLGELCQLLRIGKVHAGHRDRRVLHNSFTVHVLGVIRIHFRIGTVLVVCFGGSPHRDAEFAFHRLDLYLPLLPPSGFSFRFDDVYVLQLNILGRLWNNCRRCGWETVSIDDALFGWWLSGSAKGRKWDPGNALSRIFTHTCLSTGPARGKFHSPKPLRKCCWERRPQLSPRDRGDRLPSEGLLLQRSRECLGIVCILFVSQLRNKSEALLTIFHCRYHWEVLRPPYFVVVFIIHCCERLLDFFVLFSSAIIFVLSRPTRIFDARFLAFGAHKVKGEKNISGA